VERKEIKKAKWHGCDRRWIGCGRAESILTHILDLLDLLFYHQSDLLREQKNTTKSSLANFITGTLRKSKKCNQVVDAAPLVSSSTGNRAGLGGGDRGERG
jgi:hypothetical protein